MGRPQSFVADVEAGQRRMDLIEFINFADAIGFDPREFLDELLSEAAVVALAGPSKIGPPSRLE